MAIRGIRTCRGVVRAIPQARIQARRPAPTHMKVHHIIEKAFPSITACPSITVLEAFQLEADPQPQEPPALGLEIRVVQVILAPAAIMDLQTRLEVIISMMARIQTLPRLPPRTRPSHHPPELVVPIPRLPTSLQLLGATMMATGMVMAKTTTMGTAMARMTTTAVETITLRQLPPIQPFPIVHHPRQYQPTPTPATPDPLPPRLPVVFLAHTLIAVSQCPLGSTV